MKDTAFLIELPEDLSDEQRRAMIQRINKALRHEGIEGARVTQSQTFDSSMGGVVIYQP